ncbi:excinuclease ABC subunit C [bacterium]|nr:excinuclease ABC subunit C [bacterium]
MNIELEEKLSRVLQTSGVYLLKDNKEKILYVGKAIRLRTRLRSHFRASKNEERRHRILMAKVVDFDTIVTDSEVEALILEANFIKEHKPRYNINLKDDKSFPFIRVTNELYPRVFITRKFIRDGSRYFGPYTDAGGIRHLVASMRKIFPIRACSLRISDSTIKNGNHRICLNYHIHRCQGPCEGRIDENSYREMINQVIQFIRGKNNRLIDELKKNMHEFAACQKFEEAAQLRDELKGLKAFQNRQKVVDPRCVDRDLLTVAVSEHLAVGVVFNVRDGKITNRRHFPLTTVHGVSLPEAISALLKHYYLQADYIPSEILVSPVPDEMNLLEEWLSGKFQKKIKLIIPQRGLKAQLMDLCSRNARLILNELSLQSTNSQPVISKAVQALQKDLHLKNPPLRIEAFDISNTQGTDSVASMVVFENGKPCKSEYRTYKIRTVQGPDDFKSIAEVVERRITRLLNEEIILPDLILVDGGKGQLSSAYSVLMRLGHEGQQIIGIAKKLEEVFMPGISDPQSIPKHSASLYLLQQIRDEAHRFAINYHRKLRSKRIISSRLDKVKGIGPNKRKILLNTFGTVEGVINASDCELLAVPGITENIVLNLRKML